MKKVILHITTDDRSIQKRLFNQIKNIKNELTQHHIEVVAHAAAAEMMVTTLSYFKTEIEEIADTNVCFLVCQDSLNSLKAKQKDLITGVQIMSSALAYIITEQEDGCTYVKIS